MAFSSMSRHKVPQERRTLSLMQVKPSSRTSRATVARHRVAIGTRYVKSWSQLRETLIVYAKILISG